MNPEFERVVLEKLNSLARLEAGWDGYGSPPINRDLLDAARKMIRQLSEEGEFPTPRVVPMSGGQLQFEWDRGSRSLELEIEAPDRVHFLKDDPDRNVEEEDVYGISDTQKTAQLIRWLTGGLVSD